MPFLSIRTKDESARITADYQENGTHMRAKRIRSKNMYKFFRALGCEFSRAEEKISEIFDGRLITKSLTFLADWELAVGIPDDSFPAIGTAADRQKAVVTKLAAEGVHTKDELEWLCSLMGFKVEVIPGHYFWTNPDPRIDPPFASEKESRFTVVFEMDFANSDPESQPNLFPVDFPWQFTSNNYNILQKFMLSVIPATVNARFIVKPDTGSAGYGYFPFGLSAFGL